MARVLVIDDDAAVCKTVADFLLAAGHDAHATSDGQNGETLIDRLHPDLVIVDILMPHRDGIEIILSLRRLYPKLKIIAISGGGPRRKMTMLQMAEKLGANACLEKPFAPAALCKAVDTVLEA